MSQLFDIKETEKVEKITTVEQVVSLNIGDTVKEAKAKAAELVEIVYAGAPTGDKAGQTFKNEFVKVLFAKSARCRQMGKSLTNGGSAKAVTG